MRTRSTIARALALGLALAPAGCKEEKKSSSGDGVSAGGGGLGRAARRRGGPELEEVEGKKLRTGDGHMAGGLLYVSFRPRDVQDYWRTIPLPPNVREDGRQAQSEIGFDPFFGDWIEHFHLDEKGVVTGTFFRPLAEDFDLGIVHGGKEVPARVAALIGWHSRMVFPTDDPERTLDAFAEIFKDRDHERAREACKDVGGDRCVVSSSGELGVFRKGRGQVQADFVFWAHGKWWLEERGLLEPGDDDRPLIGVRVDEAKAAMSHEGDAPDPVGDLRGDLAFFLDPAPLPALVGIEYVEDLSWSSEGYAEADRARAADSLGTLLRLLEAPPPYAGMSLSFVAKGEDLHATAAWPRKGKLWGRMTGPKLETKDGEAEIPKVKELCRSAELCFRTLAIPDPRPLDDTLRVAGWRTLDFENILNAFDRKEEFATGIILGGGWANLLAASVAAPDSMQGFEAGPIKTIRDAVMNSDGFGGRAMSLLSGSPRYSVYARARSSDISAATGLLSLAGLETQDFPVEGGGTAKYVDVEEGSPPMHALLYATDDDFGWAMLGDSKSTLRAQLELETEPGAGPTAWFEIPDVGRLLGTLDDDDVQIIVNWGRGKRFRAVMEIGDGDPRIRAALTGADG